MSGQFLLPGFSAVPGLQGAVMAQLPLDLPPASPAGAFFAVSSCGSSASFRGVEGTAQRVFGSGVGAVNAALKLIPPGTSFFVSGNGEGAVDSALKRNPPITSISEGLPLLQNMSGYVCNTRTLFPRGNN